MSARREELSGLLAMRQRLNEAEDVLDQMTADFISRNPWAKTAIPRLLDAAGKRV